MRGQLLLGEKGWKERRDLARPDETSSVAHCFVSWVFHSASQTSDPSAPLKAPAHLSEPPGRKGAAAPPRGPGPARLPPAAPPEPGHGRGAGPRGLGRLQVGLGGMGTRGSARPWKCLPVPLLTRTSREAGHQCGCWPLSQESDTSAVPVAEPGWDVGSPSHRWHLRRALPREAGATFCRESGGMGKALMLIQKSSDVTMPHALCTSPCSLSFKALVWGPLQDTGCGPSLFLNSRPQVSPSARSCSLLFKF